MSEGNIKLQGLVGEGMRSVEQAIDVIATYASHCRTLTMVVFYPNEAAFTQFDGFILITLQPNTPLKCLVLFHQLYLHISPPRNQQLNQLWCLQSLQLLNQQFRQPFIPLEHQPSPQRAPQLPLQHTFQLCHQPVIQL